MCGRGVRARVRTGLARGRGGEVQTGVAEYTGADRQRKTGAPRDDTDPERIPGHGYRSQNLKQIERCTGGHRHIDIFVDITAYISRPIPAHKIRDSTIKRYIEIKLPRKLQRDRSSNTDTCRDKPRSTDTETHTDAAVGEVPSCWPMPANPLGMCHRPLVGPNHRSVGSGGSSIGYR
ncbi:hypothetical protein NDU88_004964 [Pleurodeles waltl]|uniref:Uncharacterized protein n=1 Tax=Pleurodeles waltl TaxID=8319 RepID=A0AAV7W9Q3_PLEWA|nr:hypothetical protein NDU88_004964 [Pleurodeles waltl]